MAKRGTRKTRRGGAWYNPWSWFAAAPEPVRTLPDNPSGSSSAAPERTFLDNPSESSSAGTTSTYTPSTYPKPGGRKKSRKTRRGGRRHHSKAAKIYGTH